MKKVININFQGRVVPIEESAYDLLKQYTESLRNYFAAEEGRDEIINDIESRISELFQERIKNGATCITDEDVNSIINNMGRPKDFADADSTIESSFTNQSRSEGFYQQTGNTQTGKRLYRDANNKVLGGVCSGMAAYFNIEPIIVRLVFIFSGIGFFAYLLLWAFVPSSDSVQNGVRKRLYRNPDSKMIAGVCSGIASYFNINVWIPRVLFLIPFISIFFRWGHFGPLSFPNFLSFSFSPGTVLIYIILWLVIPEATTTSEKLEMKGEKVDLDSIKKSVKEEMKGVKERVSIMGEEAKEFGKNFGSEIGQAAKRTRSSIGDVIVFLVKAFGYFIIGCVALVVVAALFGLAIVSIGIFPLKDYLLTDGWQTVLAWGSLLFFIGAPVIGITTWLIRRIAKIKSKNHLMRYTFLALWLLGIFCFVSLIYSVGQDFKAGNTINEENIALTNPGVKKLEVSASGRTRYYGEHGWLRFEPFANFDEDTSYVNNVRIRIVKSSTDSFSVTMVKMCNGRTRKFADTLATKINYSVQQADSTLYIDKGIAITPQDKFRNQHVVVTIAVPVGKMININKTLGWTHWEEFNGPWSHRNWDYDWDKDDEAGGWENHYGEDLIMRADGLYLLSGKRADKYWGRDNNQDDNNGDGSKPAPGVNDTTGGYRYDQTQNAIDSLTLVKEKQIQKVKDSLKKAKEQIDKRLEKLEDVKPAKEEAFLPLSNQSYDFVLDI
jgi:phage shock protein PspC (stress-responsive transcriptional regulator)